MTAVATPEKVTVISLVDRNAWDISDIHSKGSQLSWGNANPGTIKEIKKKLDWHPNVLNSVATFEQTY